MGNGRRDGAVFANLKLEKESRSVADAMEKEVGVPGR